MPRYIDADKLHLEAIPMDMGGLVFIEDVLERIYDMPTVDAEPVRHGRWVKHVMDIPEHPSRCSKCGWGDHHIRRQTVQEFRFCPNCGAKMDEEVTK